MAERAEDPVLRSARREALAALGIFVAALCYTVGYSYLFGYGRAPEELTYVLGFPDWVFWGIVVPWVTCFFISWGFAYVFMTDAPLGDDPDEAAGEVSAAGGDAPGEVDHAR